MSFPRLTPDRCDRHTVELVNAVLAVTDEWVNAPPAARDLVARVERHRRMEFALEILRRHLAPAGEAATAGIEPGRAGVEP